MSDFQIRDAQKEKIKLRIGLSAPSGGGKTYSALVLAKELAPLNKICLIDTENGRGDLYEKKFGKYQVLRLNAPFSPERYIQAIDACEKAGMEVIIIDSISHEWEGVGGCLEKVDLLGRTKFKGNKWGAWSDVTPLHQRFLDKLISSDCHII